MTLIFAGFFASSALADPIPITNWNTGNVVTVPAPEEGADGFSYIYDQLNSSDGSNVINTGSTSGYIKFTPPESISPGLEVESNTLPSTTPSASDVDNCILAAGGSTCNGDRQTGKRFKLDRTAFDPIDLVFDVDSNGSFTGTDNDGLYKVFQKYGNNTDVAIESFTVELGFGIGDGFESSTDMDGLGFVDFGATPKNNQFSALFAAGLFGEADDVHLLDGYFSDARAGFNLLFVGEDMFKSNGTFGVYETLFGDWLSYSQVPNGYFYDDDGDPLTDAILMANQEADDTWTVNRGINNLGEVVTLADDDKLIGLDLQGVEDALAANFPAPLCEPVATGVACLAGFDAIEDLAKFNLTYFIDQISVADSSYFDNFTLRFTAQAASVPEPGVLSLMAVGLGFLGFGRRKARKAGAAKL
jgi:hypothetical protein